MRLIFSICLTQISTARIVAIKAAEPEPIKYNHKGASADATKAEADDILTMAAVASHVMHVASPAQKLTANNIPRKTATPLPPLNFSQIG